MHSFDATFHRMLVTSIEEELQSQRLIVTERPLRSFDDYLLKIGRLDGLRMALRLADDVEKRLQGAASG